MATDEIKNLLLEINRRLESDANLPKAPETLIPEDISAIHNQFDLIYQDLQNMINNIKGRIETVHKTDLVMNLLNYKMYEIQYNFTMKIDSLSNRKKEIQSTAIGNESQTALALVGISKELAECEDSHDLLFRSVKEHKLEAQIAYEKCIRFLDSMLEVMKKHFNYLLLLYEAEKAQLDHEEVTEIILLEDLEKQIDEYTKMQTESWKTGGLGNLSDLPKGLKFTHAGLLITESGKHITHQQAKEQHLLDFVGASDFLTTSQDKIAPDVSLQSKASSGDSLMSSEDVNYLKKHLGVPLTLALAEITAVQPRDPIHYLGHWLFKYRYNQEIGEVQRIELEQLNEERERIATEKWKKFIEEEARNAVIDMIMRAEEEAIQNELIRIEREQEEENLEEEAKDKFVTYDDGGVEL